MLPTRTPQTYQRQLLRTIIQIVASILMSRRAVWGIAVYKVFWTDLARIRRLARLTFHLLLSKYEISILLYTNIIKLWRVCLIEHAYLRNYSRSEYIFFVLDSQLIEESYNNSRYPIYYITLDDQSLIILRSKVPQVLRMWYTQVKKLWHYKKKLCFHVIFISTINNMKYIT